MTYYGKMENGVVVFNDNATIPDGTQVRIELVQTDRGEDSEAEVSTLFRVAERAKPTGIPDLAINHDHYLYGHPKVSNG